MKKIFIVCCLVSLSACSLLTGPDSYYYKRQTRYLHSRAEPRLSMPAGLSASKVSDYFAIPYIDTTATKPASLVPPGVTMRKRHWYNVTRTTPTGQHDNQPLTVISRLDANGYPILIANKPITRVWLKVGRGLRKEKFTIVKTFPNLYTYDVRDKQSKSSKVYQIALTPRSATTMIKLTDINGTPISVDKAEKLLARINDGMMDKSTYSFKKWFGKLF